MTLAQHLAAYSQWRTQLAGSIEHFHAWLADNELNDAEAELRLAQLLDTLREDRLQVAFVAEFSRGKSELINAIFFAGYGKRMLPSAAGRTTMCPTELLFDPAKAAGIALLPIETRAGKASVTEYKRFPDEWKTVALDVGSPDAMQAALRHVSEVTRVDPATAERLGFADGHREAEESRRGADGQVEIPRWRHALINFPHPLLQQGLVILDTPGLNAVGTEPELTLSLLPNAHAVLFVIAADAGVTQSDLAIWREHIGTPGERKKGRLVVMNKIDSLWDELKSAAEVDAEIRAQADSCARTLGLPADRVFPTSAQKGLVAKINADAGLLARSRLPQLESALAGELIPARQEIVRDNAGAEFGDIHRQLRGLLESRLAGLREQLAELTELRGKNRGAIEAMMVKVRADEAAFESGLPRHYAMRSVFSTLSAKLFAHLGLDALRTLTQATREAMTAASFSRQLSEAMANFFAVTRDHLAQSNAGIGEIAAMMDALYRKFAAEHGPKLGAPAAFSLRRYENEVTRLEQWCDSHLNTMFQLLMREKGYLTQRFFEEVALQVRRAFEHANKDAEAWLKAIMAPMEAQLREQRVQLKRRLESIQRIHQATETLEERIVELTQAEAERVAQLCELEAIERRVRTVLDQGAGAPE